MRPVERDPVLRQAWVDWIKSAEIKWALFGTFTFGYHVKPDRAATLMKRYLRELSRIYRGADRGRRMVPAVVAIERHASGELHAHAAVADYGFPRRAEDLWPYGIAKVERFDSRQAGLAYVTKHVDHGSDVWITDEVFKK